MTEAEWLDDTDPERMLAFLRGRASDRKVRLFAVACCRRIWQLMTDERSRGAVEVAERFEDAHATTEELEEASDSACAVCDAELKLSPSGDGRERIPAQSSGYSAALAAYNVSVPIGWWGAAPAFVAPDKSAREATHRSTTEFAAQCNLLRDIFGNPFRPVDAELFAAAMRSKRVLTDARTIYTDRAFDRLPILADALEDAGCDNADILAHCRGGGEHVRGCWVVDLILGKH
jgi:hypothetical protein